MERYVKGERVRFYYDSKRLATGLTDVKIDIVKTDGNKEINQGSMAELNATNAPGVYYYDWVPTHGGTYLIYCDSLSDDYKRTLIEKCEIVARGSKYAQVMGVHGGMSTNRVSVRDTWTPEEKEEFMRLMSELLKQHDSLAKSILELKKESSGYSKKLSEFELKDDELRATLKLLNSSFLNQLNDKFVELGEKVKSSESKTNILSSGVKVLDSNINKNSISNYNLLSEIRNEVDKLNELDNSNKEGIKDLYSKVGEISNNLELSYKTLLKMISDEKLEELKNGL